MREDPQCHLVSACAEVDRLVAMRNSSVALSAGGGRWGDIFFGEVSECVVDLDLVLGQSSGSP